MIGTGAMGRPIAVNRLGAGHSVIVYSRTRTRGDELWSLGAEVADSIGPTCSPIYERCMPVLESISQNVSLVGEMPWQANLPSRSSRWAVSAARRSSFWLANVRRRFDARTGTENH